MEIPEEDRWSRSSPQHIDFQTFSKLLPEHFITESFALVRHPVSRLASVFRFQRDAVGSIDRDAEFGEWLASLVDQDQFYLDNHALPMARIVPQDARVFKLENGMQPLIDWLDGLADGSAGHIEMPATNKLDDLLMVLGRTPGPEVLVTEQDKALIFSIYEDDFRRFEYSPQNLSGLGV